MSVTLQPSGQLGFHRPLTQLVKRTLAVANANSQPVAFKVKTTAPKQYCVRPNSGRIEPGETVEVQVLLQPMKDDPPPGTKCRDKFLVQSVIITPEREATGLSELWSIVEKDDKAGIHEQKIRCAYLPPLEGSPVAGPGSAVTTNGAQPPHTEEDESKFATVRAPSSSVSTTNGHPSAASAFSPSPEDPTSTPPPAASSGFTADGASTSAVVSDKAKELAIGAGALAAGAASAVGLESVADKLSPKSSTSPSSSGPSSSTVPAAVARGKGGASQEDLAAQLEAARGEITRLKAQLDVAEKSAAGLRQRNITSSSSGGEAGTAQAVGQQVKGPEGVPLQVVAGIAFGVFVFTWLFF